MSAVSAACLTVAAIAGIWSDHVAFKAIATTILAIQATALIINAVMR